MGIRSNALPHHRTATATGAVSPGGFSRPAPEGVAGDRPAARIPRTGAHL